MLIEGPTPGEEELCDKLLLLHPDDSVLVAVAPISAGDRLVIDGVSLPAPEPVEVGHKLARYRLEPGDKVIKYGAPIGSVTRFVPIAGHTHSHNMKSDYISSHTRQAARGNPLND